MRKVLDIDQEKLCSLYEEGKSVNDLKCFFNCSGTAILNALKRNNVELRGKGSSRYKLNSHGLNVDYFKVINSEEKAYWLGVLTSDGTIDKGGYKVSLTSKDLDLIEKFKNAIDSEHKISTINSFDKRTNKTYIRYMIQVCSKEFANNIKSLGITNNKSYECNIPSMDKKYLSHYFRGLMDGDGSIIVEDELKNRIRVSFIATKEIIFALHNFFENEVDAAPHPIYVVSENMNMYKTYYFGDAKKVLFKIYENSNSKNRMDRKYEIYKRIV